MDIQSSSAAVSTAAAATGKTGSLESAAKVEKAPQEIQAADAPSADVSGGSVIDIKV